MPHVRPLPPAGTDNRPRGDPALAAAVAGSLLPNYYFVSPLHGFTIAQPANIVAVAIFLLTAVLVSQLVDIAREAVDAGGPRHGKLVTRRALLTELRGAPEHTDPSDLRIYMAQLRRKLEPEPDRPRYLTTEPGMGYRFQP